MPIRSGISEVPPLADTQERQSPAQVVLHGNLPIDALPNFACAFAMKNFMKKVERLGKGKAAGSSAAAQTPAKSTSVAPAGTTVSASPVPAEDAPTRILKGLLQDTSAAWLQLSPDERDDEALLSQLASRCYTLLFYTSYHAWQAAGEPAAPLGGSGARLQSRRALHVLMQLLPMLPTVTGLSELCISRRHQTLRLAMIATTAPRLGMHRLHYSGRVLACSPSHRPELLGRACRAERGQRRLCGRGEAAVAASRLAQPPRHRRRRR